MNFPLPLLMIFAMMLWGGGWPALKILSHCASWEVVTFWRFFIMTLSFIPLLIWLKKPLTLSFKALSVSFLGAFLNGLFMGLSFLGVHVGTAGAGGVVITTLSPILTVAIALIIWRQKISNKQVYGLILGAFGGILMIEIWDTNILFHSGNGVFIASALVWSILTLLAQRSRHYIDPIQFNFFLGICATVCMLVFFPLDTLSVVFDQDFKFWIALLYISILGQTVATSIYFLASGSLGSGQASMYMFLVPVFALIFSYFLLGETPSMSLLVGGLLSMIGILFIHKKEPKSCHNT